MSKYLIKTIAGIRIKGVLAEKWGLFSWFIIPVIIVFLMSLITSGGDSEEPRGELLVTDLDNTMLSSMLTGAFSQGELSNWVGIKNVDQSTAAEIMQAGHASAWLTIPENFSRDFLNQNDTRLSLVKNPAQMILPDLIESAIQLMVDAGGFSQQLLGEELALLSKSFKQKTVSDTEISMLSISLKNRIDQFSDYFDPLLIELTEKLDDQSEPQDTAISFGLLMFPGAVMMSLLFSIASLVMLIWDDHQAGVISRLSASARGLNSYFWGQHVAVLAIFTLLVLTFVLLGGSYFNIPLKQWPILVVGLVFAGMVMWQLLLVLALMLNSQKSANIVVNAAIFPILMLGGSFFPFEAMPDWLAAIGIYLPNGWLIQTLKDYLISDNTAGLWLPLLAGFTVFIGFAFINQRLLQRLVTKNPS